MSKTRRSKRWGAGALAVVTLALAIAAFEMTGTVAAGEPGEMEAMAPRYPAVLRGQLGYLPPHSSELVLDADQLPSGQRTSVTVGAPVAPVSLDLSVEGGDASQPGGNPGIDYAVRLTIRTRDRSSSVMQIVPATPVRMRNTVPGVPHVATLAFPLSSTNPVTGTVQVTGGALRFLYLATSTTQNGHHYSITGSSTFPPRTAREHVALPVPPASSISLAGYVYLEDLAGNLITRNLPRQVVNASGPVTAVWTINL